MLTINQVLKSVNSDKRNIEISMDCLNMVEGDLITAVALSRLVYWYAPARNGKPKLRVEHEGHTWLAKSHREWKEETGLSRYQVDRALSKLEQLGLAENRVFLFNYSPTKHTRLIGDKFIELYTSQR